MEEVDFLRRLACLEGRVKDLNTNPIMNILIHVPTNEPTKMIFGSHIIEDEVGDGGVSKKGNDEMGRKERWQRANALLCGLEVVRGELAGGLQRWLTKRGSGGMGSRGRRGEEEIQMFNSRLSKVDEILVGTRHRLEKIQREWQEEEEEEREDREVVPGGEGGERAQGWEGDMEGHAQDQEEKEMEKGEKKKKETRKEETRMKSKKRPFSRVKADLLGHDDRRRRGRGRPEEEEDSSSHHRQENQRVLSDIFTGLQAFRARAVAAGEELASSTTVLDDVASRTEENLDKTRRENAVMAETAREARMSLYATLVSLALVSFGFFFCFMVIRITPQYHGGL